MKFNQVIWDALCFAVRKKCPKALEALSQYAYDCDGKIKVTIPDIGGWKLAEMEFIPNPSSHY